MNVHYRRVRERQSNNDQGPVPLVYVWQACKETRRCIAPMGSEDAALPLGPRLTDNIERVTCRQCLEMTATHVQDVMKWRIR